MWTPTNLTKEEIVERALTIEDASWLLRELSLVILLLIIVDFCRLEVSGDFDAKCIPAHLGKQTPKSRRGSVKFCMPT